MNTKIIICRDCGKEVEVAKGSKKILCAECRNKSLKNHFTTITEQKVLCKHCDNVIKTIIKKGTKAKKIIRGPWVCDDCKNNKNKIEQKILCPRCKKEIGSRSINKTYQAKSYIFGPLCEECKHKTKNKYQEIRCSKCKKLIRTEVVNSNKFKDVKYSEVCDDCRYTNNKKVSRARSEYMKENNPMFKSEIKKKVSDTIKRKVKTGEIIYKKGKEHYLYKGNRDFNLECRSRLYNVWIYPILERDSFKCTKCGQHKNLQVHHIKSFVDIVKEVFNENNLDYDSCRFNREDYGEEFFEKLVNEVVKRHKLSDGKTLCKQCHSEEDYYYRPFKGENKNEDKINKL